MVLLLPDHDLGSHAPRQRVSLLLSLLHHWQNLILHWSAGLECHYRCKSAWKQQHAVLFLVRAVLSERRVLGIVFGSEEESGGTGEIFDGGRAGEGEARWEPGELTYLTGRLDA